MFTRVAGASSKTFSLFRFRCAASAAILLSSGAALATDNPADLKGEAKSCKAAITTPSFSGIIKQNPDPACLTVGGFGDVYLGGAITGYAYTQTNPLPFSPSPLPSDRSGRVDLSNIQLFVQKADGPVQFYVQVGAYAIPALGVVNLRALDQTDLLFTPLPVAYGKVVLGDAFSVQAGRMPTLIGTEAPFTFQNLNIQRGLLFNQENTINQGVQLNYASGPLSTSIAATDGFFSGRLNWFTGAVTYKLDDNNALGVNGGFNFDRTNSAIRSRRYQFATPLLQQNSGIVTVNYSYTNGPLTITPYVQFTHVDRDLQLGIAQGASTYGGAVLASYALSNSFALAGRVEYEEQTGRRGSGTTSLLYGAGSSAWSFTVTPTYTVGRFFLRGEYSRVELAGTTRGDLALGEIGTGFGRTGNETSQDRYLVEAGLTF